MDLWVGSHRIYFELFLAAIDRIRAKLFDMPKLYDKLSKAIMDNVDELDMYQNTENLPNLKLVDFFCYCTDNFIFIY